MTALRKAIKNLRCLTADDVKELKKRPASEGNTAAFLRAACGLMTEAEGARFQELINEGCERIDD
jgi:hypothetical protein